MAQYMIAAGHNIALESLVDVTPQPLGRPIRATQTTYGLTGQRHQMALYTEWVFGAIATADEYDDLLMQLGLDDADSADVTVYTRVERLTFARFNTTILMPDMGRETDWNRGFLDPITFTLTRLKAL